MSGTDIDVVPNSPKCPIPVLMLYRSYRSVWYRCESLYRYRRYRCPCTELTEVSGTGVDIYISPKCPITVMLYRSCQSVWYPCESLYRYRRYRCPCTELAEVSGTDIDVVPNSPKCPIPVLMLYRSYRSVWYRCESLYRYRRYRCPCTELTEVSGTGMHVVPNVPKSPLPVLMYRTYRSVRYRY